MLEISSLYYLRELWELGHGREREETTNMG
jgi:hypothetical protein